MPRFNQNLNEFGVTPSYKHEELPGGWCTAQMFNSHLNRSKKKKTRTHAPKLYEDVILLTLQLLYYRSWVSRTKYTHVKAGTRNTRTVGTWNTRNTEHPDSRNMEHTELPTLSLEAVTHTHPTIPSMFIPPQRLIRPPGCIYAHEIYCMNGSTHDE